MYLRDSIVSQARPLAAHTVSQFSPSSPTNQPVDGGAEGGSGGEGGGGEGGGCRHQQMRWRAGSVRSHLCPQKPLFAFGTGTPQNPLSLL